MAPSTTTRTTAGPAAVAVAGGGRGGAAATPRGKTTSTPPSRVLVVDGGGMAVRGRRRDDGADAAFEFRRHRRRRRRRLGVAISIAEDSRRRRRLLPPPLRGSGTMTSSSSSSSSSSTPRRARNQVCGSMWPSSRGFSLRPADLLSLLLVVLDSESCRVAKLLSTADTIHHKKSKTDDRRPTIPNFHSHMKILDSFLGVGAAAGQRSGACRTKCTYLRGNSILSFEHRIHPLSGKRYYCIVCKRVR
jgi:hypothetical protein